MRVSEAGPRVPALEVAVSDRRVIVLASLATLTLLAWSLMAAMGLPVLAGPVEALIAGSVLALLAVVGAWASLLRRQ